MSCRQWMGEVRKDQAGAAERLMSFYGGGEE